MTRKKSKIKFPRLDLNGYICIYKLIKITTSHLEKKVEKKLKKISNSQKNVLYLSY